MDITPGHWVFALIFAIAFIGILIWSFKKEKKLISVNYGNAGSVAMLVGGIILLLIIVKFALRQINH
jgi:predicted branched-subunit amino acid permease